MKSLRDEILLCRVMQVGRWACSRLKKLQRRAWRPRHAVKSLHLTREVARSDGRREKHSACFVRSCGYIFNHNSPCEMGTEELFCKRKSQNLLRPHFANSKIFLYRLRGQISIKNENKHSNRFKFLLKQKRVESRFFCNFLSTEKFFSKILR